MASSLPDEGVDALLDELDDLLADKDSAPQPSRHVTRPAPRPVSFVEPSRGKPVDDIDTLLADLCGPPSPPSAGVRFAKPKPSTGSTVVVPSGSFPAGSASPKGDESG